jgi:hypothetical protein
MYQLVYDALGRCVKRSLNGLTTYYVYDGEKPILEYAAGGASVGDGGNGVVSKYLTFVRGLSHAVRKWPGRRVCSLKARCIISVPAAIAGRRYLNY